MKIEVKKNIMATNSSVAGGNRQRLAEHGVCMSVSYTHLTLPTNREV